MSVEVRARKADDERNQSFPFMSLWMTRLMRREMTQRAVLMYRSCHDDDNHTEDCRTMRFIEFIRRDEITDQQKPHIAQLLNLANSTLTFIYGNKTGAEANAGAGASVFPSVEALSVSSSLPGPALIDAWGYCKKKLPTTSAIRLSP